jgi:putative ABC transport system permease protein
VLLLALRDLQFRLRRFLISVVAVGLVLALTLLLAGLAASFSVEVDRTLDQLGVDTWVVADDAGGPFFSATPISEDHVDIVAAAPGVTRASALAYYNATIERPGGHGNVLLMGVEPSALGAPEPDEGAPLARRREVIVDSGLGLGLGDVLPIGGTTFTVVGTLNGSTLIGGTPNVFLHLDDLQDFAFQGAAVIMSVAVEGEPDESALTGLQLMTRDDAAEDLLRPLGNASETITLISVLLWIVTGCIIGSVIYLSVLERARDFAVMKSIGVTSSWVLGGLVLQAIVLSVSASAIAIALAAILDPRMAVPVELSAQLLILIVLTAVVVSLVGSVVGVRRALRVDPALAFG